MARVRSPSYPSYSLEDAIENTNKIFAADRTNPVDREVVAKHLGYNGLNGAADKSLATLMQYGLTEKVAKGEIRVSQTAIDILYPDTPQQKNDALIKSAYSPPLFKTLSERFDGAPSQEALKAYLLRESFNDRAIGPIITAYTKTCAFLERENATESGGMGSQEVEESVSHSEQDEVSMTPAQKEVSAIIGGGTVPVSKVPINPQFAGGSPEWVEMEGERVVYREEGEPGQYLKLVASGDLDDYLLEAIEDFVKRQRKRLQKAEGKTSQVGSIDID